MPEIYEDTRQQAGKHEVKHGWWDAHGVAITRRKLDFGDYAAEGSNVYVDTKRNVAEVAMNISGRNHARFKRECVRARDAGCRLVVLVENRNGYETLDDVKKWTNDHCRACGTRKSAGCNPYGGGNCQRHGTRKPIQGPRLAKAMSTMEERYGVRFMFCKPKDSARIVCELLGVGYEENGDDSVRD